MGTNKKKQRKIMRASAILALASLMSNMTEAVKVTAAGSGIGPAKLYATPDCSGDFEEKKRGSFCTASRPWCKPANSVEIPVGKTLVVKYEDLSARLAGHGASRLILSKFLWARLLW